ncbi:MAG: phosphoglycerate mutase family protein [Acidobacteriota bacterium]
MMVILVRHAERQQSGDDPGLSAAGKRRAQLLSTMFAKAGVTAMFTSSARRTKDTAAPLATAAGVAPHVIDDDTAKAKAQILGGGACVMVVGHSDTVPEFIAALGGPAVTIEDDQFDRLFVVGTTGAGPASLLAMQYVSA